MKLEDELRYKCIIDRDAGDEDTIDYYVDWLQRDIGYALMNAFLSRDRIPYDEPVRLPPCCKYVYVEGKIDL